MDENSNDMTTPQEPVPAQASQPITPATPLPAPAPAPAAEKGTGVRTLVLAGVSAVVGAVLVLVGGVVGYSIGNHDGGNHREESLTVAADRNGQSGGEQGGPMMGNQDSRGGDRDGDNWSGPDRDGGMMGGQQGDLGNGPMFDDQQGAPGNGPMMMGNGIQDFLNQLQSGQGLSPDQQQFLDQLKGFVGGMRNQMG